MTRQNIDEKRWGDTLTLRGGQMGGLPISPPSKTIISFSISSLVRRFSKMCGGEQSLGASAAASSTFYCNDDDDGA